MHKHHIIPKHAGGTDDPSNLVELTVEEHAEAHRKLYEEYGRWQDEVAYKALSGMIGKEEVIREVQSKSHLNRDKEKHAEAVRRSRLGVPISQSARDAISKSLTGRKQSPETIAKRVAKTKGQKRPIMKERVSGGNNGSAKSIVVNGNKYSTIKEAEQVTGISRYLLRKRLK